MREEILLQTVSAATSVKSGFTDLGDLTSFCIDVIITGSDVAGTVALECSRDGVTVKTVTDSSISITNSADTIYDVAACGYRFVRVSWTYSSGTGNITVKNTIKEHSVKMGG